VHFHLHWLRVYIILSNRARDKKYGVAESTEGEVLDGIRLGMHDLTVLENPDFRYIL
jgi:MFS transporter, ACS family, allantoate permease